MIKSTLGEIKYDFENDKFVGIKLLSPLSVCWQVTTKCNLFCKYCLSSSGPQNKIGLPTEKAVEVIKHLGELNIARLDFTGGEPLIRDDLGVLIQEAQKQSINVLVTTNTLLLTNEKIRYLKEFQPIIQVSIDGPETVHNHIRNKDVFSKTIDNIKRLIDEGCKVRINSFLTKQTYKHIDYLLNLSKSLNIFSHLFIIFTPQGRGCDHLEEIIPENEVEAIKHKLIKIRDKTGYYIRIYDYREYEHSCVLLQPDGTVISQGFLQDECYEVGNLLETPLDIIFSSEHFNHTTHLLHYLQKRAYSN